MKMVVLSDTHIGDKVVGEGSWARHCDLGEIFFLRAAHRINRFIKPDLVVVLGDMVNEGSSPQAAEKYLRLSEIFNMIKADKIIIPGNHDCPEEEFYSYFPRPPRFLDKDNVRVVPFVDPEEPGCNASRNKDGMRLMDMARSGWKGRVISVHHVPLFPHGSHECPYNYTNADDIIASMRRNGISMAVGGHYHPGFDFVEREGISFCAAPGLCEGSFSFLQLDIDSEGQSITWHHLRLPADLELTDLHIHTKFAYCDENMDVQKTLRLAKLFNLKGLAFAEHSAHLLYNREDYLSGAPYAKGASAANPADNRVADYIRELDENDIPMLSRGIELDIDGEGNPIAGPGDLENFGFILGSVHSLKSANTLSPRMDKVKDEFMFLNARLADLGVHAIAHPFRVFRRAHIAVPKDLFDLKSVILQ